MSNTTVCTDTSEAMELFSSQGLYLKPIAKVNICVQLPQLKSAGKTISNWEVMEKLKHMARPETFLGLKIFKSTLEFIRLEGEIENKSKIQTIILKLDGKTIKLSGFTEILKIRAAEAKVNFPSRHDWDSYFRDAKNMNEMKPGERPDTIHLRDLPTRWFSNYSDKESDELKPSEIVVRKVFQTFGELRCIDIPMLDHYRKEIYCNLKKNNIQTFSYGQDLTFECYVQYMDYISFVKAMDSLRGMKLLHKGEEKAVTAIIKVDFDKTKHLSEKNIRRRRIERDKLEVLEKERLERARREKEEEERKKQEERRKKEEEERDRERRRQEKIQRKEDRRKEREEKRRQKKIEKKQKEEEERMQYRIALEERRLLIAERKLESLRLVTELFERVKVLRAKKYREDKEKELEEKRRQEIEDEKRRKEEEEYRKQEAKRLKKEKLKQQEQELRNKILKNFKFKESRKQDEEREQLRKKLSGTKKLKSAVIMREAVEETVKKRKKKMEVENVSSDEDEVKKVRLDGTPKAPRGRHKRPAVTSKVFSFGHKKSFPPKKPVRKREQDFKQSHKTATSQSDVYEDVSPDELENKPSVMEQVLNSNRMRAWRDDPPDREDGTPPRDHQFSRGRGRGRFQKNRSGEIAERRNPNMERNRRERDEERSRSNSSDDHSDKSRSGERSDGENGNVERRHRTPVGEDESSRHEFRQYEMRGRRGRGPPHMPPMMPRPPRPGVMMPVPPGHPMMMPPPFFRPPFPFRGRGMPPPPHPMRMRGMMRGGRMPPPMRGMNVFAKKSYLRKYNHILGWNNQMKDMYGRYMAPIQVAVPGREKDRHKHKSKRRHRDSKEESSSSSDRESSRRRHRRSRSKSSRSSRSYSDRSRSYSHDRSRSSSRERSRSRSRHRSRSYSRDRSRSSSGSRDSRDKRHSKHRRSYSRNYSRSDSSESDRTESRDRSRNRDLPDTSSEKDEASDKDNGKAEADSSSK